jgi:uncharacterized protein YjiS (DUF1127 family)
MFDRFRAAIRAAADRAHQRQDYRALLALDEHLLRDIGLPRDEIRARMTRKDA